MADPVVTCVNPNISLHELLKSVLVRKISTGEVGIRRINITAAANDIEPYMLACGSPGLSETDILRMIFGLTATSQVAVVTIVET